MMWGNEKLLVRKIRVCFLMVSLDSRFALRSASGDRFWSSHVLSIPTHLADLFKSRVRVLMLSCMLVLCCTRIAVAWLHFRKIILQEKQTHDCWRKKPCFVEAPTRATHPRAVHRVASGCGGSGRLLAVTPTISLPFRHVRHVTNEYLRVAPFALLPTPRRTSGGDRRLVAIPTISLVHRSLSSRLICPCTSVVWHVYVERTVLAAARILKVSAGTRHVCDFLDYRNEP